MDKGEQDSRQIPPWVSQVVMLGGVIVSLSVFSLNTKADVRSTREQVDRIAADVAAIKSSLPNREVYDLKLHALEEQIAVMAADLKFEAARNQALREKLIKKHWID